MNTTSERRPGLRVVVGFDGSDGARAAVEDLGRAGLPEEAEALVLACADVPLDPPFYTVVPVEGGGVVPQSAIDAAREAGEREAERARATAAAGVDLLSGLLPRWKVEADTAPGSPYWHLVERAERMHADLVVVGAHARSAAGRLFFGSVSQNVLSHAPCSVRVGRGGTADARGVAAAPVRVLLGVDGSPDAAAAVDIVCSRNWPAGTEVRVATAVDVPPSLDLTVLIASPDERHTISPVQALVHSVGDRLRDSKLDATTVVLDGNPRHALLAEAQRWGAHCVFLGARGHSRLERFFIGSVSASVAARAHCSVEVVRGRK
jgi:nucleotide-binding universal stress UspA family protein